MGRRTSFSCSDDLRGAATRVPGRRARRRSSSSARPGAAVGGGRGGHRRWPRRRAAAGHPPGTVDRCRWAPTWAPAVKKVQDAITANGGTVLATVDNAADVRATRRHVPANTVVIGGSPATGLPMLRTNQQAAAALPERYLRAAGRHRRRPARLQRTGLRRGRRPASSTSPRPPRSRRRSHRSPTRSAGTAGTTSPRR